MRASILAQLGCSIALGAQAVAATNYSVRTVYQFASNTTWMENVAVRSNGIVLTTEIGPPANLLAFDPSETNATKKVVANFDSVLGITGITEGAHDVFYITGANTTSANIQDPPTNATHLWRVDFNKNESSPEVTLISRPQAPTGFNGLAAYNDSIILATASFQSSIFAVDVTTGAAWEAIKNDLMTQINGIKVQDGYVYWTAGADFCRATLHANLTATGEEVLATGSAFDDFALGYDGFQLNAGDNTTKYAYATTAAYNTIMQIGFSDGSWNETTIIAGDLNSVEVAEPTGAAFGRIEGQKNKLYVTTGGGSGLPVDVDGVETAVGAQLLEITIS